MKRETDKERVSPASRRVRPVVALLAALLGVALPVVRAGDSDSPRTGPRVRVTLASSGERVVGRLVEQDEVVLLLEKGSRKKPEPLRIRRSDVAHIERSVRRGRRGRGAAIGALLGAGIAVGVALAGGNDCSEEGLALDNILCSRTDKSLMVGLLTVPLGTLIGAVASPGEQWRPESLSRFAVGVGPAPGGGVSARLALRF